MTRRNKYGVAPKQERTLNGITYDSKKEMKRHQELLLLEKAGEIRNLKRQVVLPFIFPDGRRIETPAGRIMGYYADFAYFEGDKRVYEDCKGFDTRVSQIKRAIVKAIYGTEVRLT